MRAGVVLAACALLLAGCTGGGQGLEAEVGGEKETLDGVVKGTIRALLAKDLAFLVDHHWDGYCQSQDGEQVTRQEYRAKMERYFASEDWRTVYGDAERPHDVWDVPNATYQNFSELAKDPNWERVEDICDFYPTDQVVRIKRSTGSRSPQDFLGFYRQIHGVWQRIGE